MGNLEEEEEEVVVVEVQKSPGGRRRFLWSQEVFSSKLNSMLENAFESLCAKLGPSLILLQSSNLEM